MFYSQNRAFPTYLGPDRPGDRPPLPTEVELDDGSVYTWNIKKFGEVGKIACNYNQAYILNSSSKQNWNNISTTFSKQNNQQEPSFVTVCIKLQLHTTSGIGLGGKMVYDALDKSDIVCYLRAWK